MKLNKFIFSLIMAALLLTLGACRDELFDNMGHWNGKVPDEWEVTLVLAEPTDVEIGTRANETDAIIERLNVICYDLNGTVLSNEPITDESELAVNNNKVTLTLSLHQDTKTLEVVANCEEAAQITVGSKKKGSDIVPTQAADANPIFWGSKIIDDVMETSSMFLIRNAAMLTMDNDATSTFKLEEMGVFGSTDKGTIAPSSANVTIGQTTMSATRPTIPADVKLLGIKSDKAAQAKDSLVAANLYKTWSESSKTIDRIFETKAGNLKYENNKLTGHDFVRVIVKGTYTDPYDRTSIPGYYVIALWERSENTTEGSPAISEHPGDYQYGELLPVLRNHNYKIRITEVRGEGWSTLAQAMTALPDNRLTYYVEDVSPDITDIEATRDYYLGVSGNVTVNYSENAVISIITDYPGLNGKDKWKERIAFESGGDDDWIHLNNISADKPDDYNASKLDLKVTISLDQNLDSRNRYGHIKVRAGKLSREISITQLGCPYNRRRTIVLEGLTKEGISHTISDYYKFLDGVEYDGDGNAIEGSTVAEKLLGAKTSENRGVSRNGLHFPIVPLYDYASYTFKIPKRDADGTPKFKNNSGTFTVSQVGGNWEVKLSATAQGEIKSSSDVLVIPTVIGEGDAATSVNVEYPLFRTGIIHYLPETSDQPDVPEVRRSGWFYYDIAKVGNCYVLDRNLGASTSAAYSPVVTDYKDNKEAIGGYFKVNRERWGDCAKDTPTQNRREDQHTVTYKSNSTDLYLRNTDGSGFVPATEADYNSMNLLVSGGLVSASTTTSRIPDKTIYFPKAGYYEGEEFKSTNHCLLWTRTYLGGTQGLSPTAPEYGYWYRYFDDMKSTTAANRFSNVRMARGSNGMAPDETSLWRYMPLRLVWVNSNCTNPDGSSTVEQEVISNKMIIYFRNTKGMSTVRYHGWNLNSGDTSWDSRPTATKVTNVTGEDNLYKVEIAAPSNASAGIMFTTSNTSDTNWTWDYKDLYSHYQAGETVLLLEPQTSENRTTQDAPFTRWTVTCKEASNIDFYANGGTVDPPEPTPTTTYKYYLSGDLFGSWGDKEFTSANSYTLTDYNVTNASGQGFQIKEVKTVTGTTTTTTTTNYTFPSNPSLGTAVSYGTGTGYGNNWKLSSTGTYTFVLNPTAKTLTVTKKQEVVTITDLYLRGAMTESWKALPAYKMASSDGNIYTITVTGLGDGQFKFGTGESENWSKSYGGTGNSEPYTISSAGSFNYGSGNAGKNMKLGDDLKDATVTFTLNLTAGTIKVDEIKDMYFVGDKSGWNPSNSDYKMSTTDGVTYKITISDMSGGFKFCGGAWGTREFTNGQSNLIDGTYELTGGNNMYLKNSGKTVTFTLVQSNNFSSAKLTISGSN